MITVILVIPLIGLALLLLLSGDNHRLLRLLTFGTMLAGFLVSLALLAYPNSPPPPAELYVDHPFAHAAFSQFRYVERLPWIPSLNIEYFVGVDGISLWLVLLTTFLGPIVVLSTWDSITSQVKGFMGCLLLLQTGMVGAFVALDLLLFYLFWEVMLIPMIFIIGIWGGQRRLYAAIKFLLYTMIGSLLMLVAIIYLYINAGGSFDLFRIYAATLNPMPSLILFCAFALAFAIKVPMFPFHTWLPDAHVEAPTAGSVILAGVLLKMGTYGFLRFAIPLFPEIALTAGSVISILAVIGIVYGALVALVQPDIKKLVAYSSVSHLGFVILGLFAFNTTGMGGGLLQMINHGVSTGALFLLVGMIYDRRHTRLISEFGGITSVMPLFATIFMLTAFSSVGLPGLNGFVGEFLILLGTFDERPWLAGIATTGVILSAAYMLWMLRRVLFGTVQNEQNRHLQDLNLRELLVMAPLVVMMIGLGVFPTPFLEKMRGSIEPIVTRLDSTRATLAGAPLMTSGLGVVVAAPEHQEGVANR